MASLCSMRAAHMFLQLLAMLSAPFRVGSGPMPRSAASSARRRSARCRHTKHTALWLSAILCLTCSPVIDGQEITSASMADTTAQLLVTPASTATADNLAKMIHPPSNQFRLKPKPVLVSNGRLRVDHDRSQAVYAITVATPCGVLLIVFYMQPGQGRGGQGTNVGYRTPPSWGPEMEARYPFRHWSRDVLVWTILTDMDPARKAAAVILQLRGGAEELARGLPPQAIVAGGLINGVQADPMTFLMHSLSERYAQLGEETRLSAIAELMTFQRNGHERIDDLITRFDIIRQRANDQGQMALSVQGLTWILLRACQVNDTQLTQLLAPMQGLFPGTEAEYSQLRIILRRMGHIIERSPGNIAQQLHGRNHNQQQSQAFFVGGGVAEAADPWSSAFNASPAYPAYPSAHAQYGSHPSAHDQYSQQSAYPAVPFDLQSDNGTDSDTVSSLGDTAYLVDMPQGLDPSGIAEHLFWAYQQAKGAWRQHMGKPVRAVRRFVKRKGKGVLSSIFMVSTANGELDADSVIPIPASTAGWHSSTASNQSVRAAQAFDPAALSVPDPSAQVLAMPQHSMQRHGLPPPEVPAWSNLPAFAMNVHGGSMQAPGDVLPNFPGAAGGPSTRKGKGKGRRDRTIVDYDGDDQTCALCLEDFSDGEAVLRLVCRHCFHIECWNHMLSTYEEEDMECPNCRGSARVTARFRFLALDVTSYERTPVHRAAAVHHNMTTGSTPAHSHMPSRDPSPASSGYDTPSSTVLPWWPASATDVTSVLHSATRLADGRMSIIVDPGAWTNLAGARFARMQAQRAVAAGHTPSQSPMTRPLQIQGVGNGVQSAKWQTELPIAVPNADGTATLHRFEAPTVEGSGEDLPALLGLRSIRSKQGVLETAEGKERLSFPGPGGYSIEWSPGTLHFDLEVAPSGHYVIPCDSFDLLSNTAAGGSGGLPPASVILHARHSAPAPSTLEVHHASASSSVIQPSAPVAHQGSAVPLASRNQSAGSS
ncbi:unnamed protein product [Polarella glacialis]|uniref:RING-type domain-containing protein n=1 Tax=Polarella glacialis TaxID=89957 RepID=A0A813GA66_POLGL|nr:unnamed protein product [Polarella glacialis]